MALDICIQPNFHINFETNILKKQDVLASQGSTEVFNAKNNKAFTFSKALTPFLVFFSY